MRPAELLALQGVYETPEQARAALDGMGKLMAQAMVVLLPLSAAARSMSAFSSDATRTSSLPSRAALAIAFATSSTGFCLIVRHIAVQSKFAADTPLPCGYRKDRGGWTDG
jgi:hypothetical protein